MITSGLVCLAVFLVFSAAALVRGRCAERADRRRLTAIVDQAKRHIQAELGGEWTRRQT
jgi:hypothetical protein